MMTDPTSNIADKGEHRGGPTRVNKGADVNTSQNSTHLPIDAQQIEVSTGSSWMELGMAKEMIEPDE